jgi:hypothetical protein
MIGYADFLLAATRDAKKTIFAGYGNDKMPSDKTGCPGDHYSR